MDQIISGHKKKNRFLIFFIIGFIVLGSISLFFATGNSLLDIYLQDSPNEETEGVLSNVGEETGINDEEPVRYTPPYTIGEKCYSSYDSINKIMTDTSCLQFKTETNGVITINNERYLAFALKGKIDGIEYTYTSMDFDWTWHIEKNNEDYTFWAENNNPNFIWRQYYYFYE